MYKYCVFLFVYFFTYTLHAKDKVVPRPNVIIIMADDLGWGDVGCYGAKRVKTPHIDRLASEGIRFTDAYSSASTCSPTRYSLLTGNYAFRNGLGILNGDANLTISTSHPTMGKMFQSQGYTTALVGKWHLGLGEGKIDYNTKISPGPLEVGFDQAYYIPTTVDRVPCVFIDGHYVDNLDPNDPIVLDMKTPPGDDYPDGKKNPWSMKLKINTNWHNASVINGIGRIGYMNGGKSALWDDYSIADTITSKAINFIEENKDKPFFLYFATHDVHSPRLPAKRFQGSSQCGIRGDAVQQFDWSVGEIMKTLKRLSLDENTIVVVTSDNGPYVEDGYCDGAAYNLNGHLPAGPFCGYKYALYEGSVRVPFITWGKGITSDKICDTPLNMVDLYGSFASLLNVELDTHNIKDSQDISSLLMYGKGKPKREYVIVQDNSGHLAIRQGDWKLILKEGLSFPDSVDELYDLKNDPSERINLATKYPKRVEQLKNIIDQEKYR